MTANQILRAAVVPVTAGILLLQFVANAWVSEDAHITFRAIENFSNGHGLRWNVDERVGVYTHPLWMALIALAYAATGEFYFTVTAISLTLSVSAYLILVRTWSDRPVFVALAVFAPIALSTTLVRYATSGFENSLTLFLYSIFASMMLRADRGTTLSLFKLSLIAALAAVNRLDALLLFVPALASSFVASQPTRRSTKIALGFAPLFGWLLFSVFYYGFPFPNTALAKLSAEVPRHLYLTNGISYWADLLLHDPVSGMVLSLGVVAAVALLVQLPSRRNDPAIVRPASVGAGILLYSGYVVWIGGDFLSGRFWAAPVFASIALCAALLDRAREGKPRREPRTAIAVVAVLMLVLGGARVLASEIETRIPGRVQPLSTARVTLSRDLRWEPSDTASVFRLVGEELRQRAQSNQPLVEAYPVVGFVGLAAGPNVIIIDPHALADPLLARMPPANPFEIKVGHLQREIPVGYRKARETGSTGDMDPDLADYYSKLRLIIAGPLFDRERIETLVRFNLGAYDELLNRYLERVKSPGLRSDSHSP
jgi:arabinofuranosyltransferase